MENLKIKSKEQSKVGCQVEYLIGCRQDGGEKLEKIGCCVDLARQGFLPKDRRFLVKNTRDQVPNKLLFVRFLRLPIHGYMQYSCLANKQALESCEKSNTQHAYPLAQILCGKKQGRTNRQASTALAHTACLTVSVRFPRWKLIRLATHTQTTAKGLFRVDCSRAGTRQQ